MDGRTVAASLLVKASLCGRPAGPVDCSLYRPTLQLSHCEHGWRTVLSASLVQAVSLSHMVRARRIHNTSGL